MEPGIEQVIIMIGTLILKKTGGIDQPVLKCKIPVRLDILGMHYFNDLLYPAAQKIIQFGIWAGGIKEPDFIQGPFIYIKSMKARIKTGLLHR